MYGNKYFNGNNNTIRNIYIHQKEGKIALFSNIGEVKNLKLTGIIINDTWEAGGITYNAASIENCINYANVTGYNFVGGICSRVSNYIKDCTNYGNITITGAEYAYSCAAGIGGSEVQKYSNCINYRNCDWLQYGIYCWNMRMCWNEWDDDSGIM